MHNNFTQAAGLGTGPESLEPYRSQHYFDLEREKIFRRTWLIMGRIEDLPNAGDYIVKEVEICNASILITRQAGGAVRAFHNICSHRGNQIVWDTKGSRKTMFRCTTTGLMAMTAGYWLSEMRSSSSVSTKRSADLMRSSATFGTAGSSSI